MSCLRVLVAALVAFPPSAWANPVLDAVAAGSASFGSTADTLTVIQHTDNAIINWSSFSIAHGETTQFVQPSAMSAVLNRVTGGDPSSIYGTLSANGRVFLINPNGVMVGPTGVINTQSFTASTLGLSDAQFLAGGPLLFAGNSAASILNAGRITALGGDILLFARTVTNAGELIAKDGLAAMGAGSEVLLQPAGEQRVFVKSGAGESAATGVDNQGRIEAATAELKAAGGNAYALAINNAGVIRANGVERRGGRVYLTAQDGNVALRAGSVIDASGENGGGTVLIGGGAQGQDASVANAKSVVVEEGATVRADATENGDGGKVVVWSDESTSYKGTISATGGAEGGNGGQVEVSGGYLAFDGMVDLSAPKGLLGELLLDPFNITIQTAGSPAIGCSGGNCNGTSTDSTLTVSSLLNALNNSNVTVQTTGGTGAGNGNITVANSVTWNNNRSLTLRANNSVVVNAAVTNNGSGGVTMTSNSSGANPTGTIGLNANVSTDGGSQVYNGAVVLGGGARTLGTNGGDITFQGTVDGAQSLALNAGNGGDINFNGRVGNTAALASLTTSGGGTTNVGSGVTEIKTTGTQTYGEAMSLQGNTALTTTNSLIALNNAVNGSNNDTRTLTLKSGTAGVNLSNVGTGFNQRLSALDVTNVGGPIGLNGTVNTNQAQTYSQAINLNGASGLSTGNGAITLNGAVNGSQSLTLNSGSQATNLNGTLGATTRLGALTVNGTGNSANLNNSAATAFRTGTQTWAKGVNLLADATLDTAGGTINLNGPVTGAGRALTLASGAGAVNLSDVGVGGALTAVNLTGTGVVDLGGNVNTVNAQNYAQNVTLSNNATLTTANNAISFGGTVNNQSSTARALTLNAGNAAVNIGSAGTGANGALTSVTFGNTGGVNLGGTLYTTAAQTYTNQQNMTLTGAAGLRTTGANITLGNTITGANQSLNIDSGNGSIFLNGGITGVGALTVGAANSGGVTNLNTAAVTTNGAQTWNKALALSADTTLTSGSGGVDINGAVTGGGKSLAIVANNNGPVGLNNVGTNSAGGRLNSVSVVGGGALNLGGGVYTNNAQSFAQNVTLAGNTVLDAAAGGITLGGTVNGSSSLTLNAGSGNVNVNGAIGNTSALDALTISGSGTTNLNTTTVKTNGGGAQTYGEAVVLGQNTALTTNGGAVVFSKTVDGAKSLTLTTTGNNNDGNVTFGGAVGAGTALSALIIDQSNIGGNGGGGNGIVYVNGGAVNTNGAQTYGNEIIMNANTVLNSNGGAFYFNDHVNGTVTGGQSLAVNAGAGNIFFNRRVGGDHALASLTIGAGTGVTDIDTGGIQTTGNQLYGQNVALTNDPDFTTTGGNITFMGTINGGHDILMSPVGGNVVFNGAVGNTTSLDSLTVTGTGKTSINGGLVRTVNNQSYGEDVLLGADTTINATGAGSVSFNKTVNGAKNLTVTPNSGSVTFTGAVGDVTHLTSLTVNAGNGNGTTNLNDSTITTDGNQTYGQKVAVGGNETLSSNGGSVLFSNTVNGNGARTLAVNAGAGNITFSNTVGANTALTSLTLSGTGTTNLNGNSVRTTGAQSYGEKVQLGTDNALTTTSGGSILFSDTVNGAKALTASVGSGNVTFSNAVGNAATLTSLGITGTGTTNLNGGSVRTSGSQTYGESVLLGTDDALTTTANGSVLFSGTVNGAKALTASVGAGNVTFSNAVGNTAALTSLGITGTGTTNLNGNSVRTSGDQTYGENAALGTDDALTTTANGSVLFSGSVNGARNLAATVGAGNVTFSNAVGNTAALTSLGITGTGTTNLNGNTVRTTGAQNYGENVVLGTDNALTSTANGSILFSGTVNGAKALTASVGAGNVTFSNAVGNTATLTSLGITGTGTTNLNGGSVRTSGNQSYGESVLLGTDDALTTTADGSVLFSGTVNGAKALTASVGAGNVTFSNTVGNTAALTSLGITGTGTTNLNGSSVRTSGNQTYGENVQLGTDDVLTTTANGSVLFSGTVNGAKALTASVGAGNVTFSNAVGNAAALTSLGITGTGTTNLNGSSVRTSGGQTYGENVLLGTDDALTATTNGNVVFSGTVNGARALTATTGGQTAFNGVVGGNAALTALTTNGAGGTTNINTTAIVTTGDQNYNAATLSQTSVLTAANNGAIDFNGTLDAATDGAQGLTATTGGQVAFNGVVGGVKKLSSLTINGAGGTTNINTNAIKTTGDQNYNAATLSQTSVLTAANNGAINFNGTLDAAADGVQGLTATTGGQTSFNGVVGGGQRLSALTTNGAGTTNINTTAVNTTGAQNYDATTLSQTATLAGGAVAFNGSLDAATDGAQGLTATAGSVSFNGLVGAGKKLSTLTTAGGTTNINAASIATTGDQNYDATTVSQTAALTSANSGAIAFNGTLDAAADGVQGLTATTGGRTTFNGVVGGGRRLASLTTDGAGTTDINTTAVNTTGAQNYDATTLSQTATLTGGSVAFNGALDAATDGAQGLTATAGSATFNGLVGAGKKLASLTTAGGATTINTTAIATTGDQVYDATTLSQDSTLTSAAGGIAFGSTVGGSKLTTNSALDTSFDGAVNNAGLDASAATIRLNDGRVTTSGDQTYRSAVAAPGAIDLAAGGLINLDGGSVVTGGAQDYRTNAVLGADTSIASTNGGVTFGGKLNGAHAIVIDSGLGDIALKDAVGDGAALTGATFNGAGTTHLDGGAFNTSGAQDFNEAVVLGANATLDSNGGTVSFAKTIDGAQDLTVNAGAGNVNFFGAIGDGPALASLTIGAGSGTTDINGARVTTTGAQTYGQKVVLSDDAYLKSTNSGAVVFNETVDGTVVGQQGLTVETDGAITFYKDIGASVALEYLTLIGSGIHTILGDVHTVGNIDFFDDLFLSRDLNLFSGGGRIWFHKRVNSAATGFYSLGAHADAGDVVFAGAVGDVRALNLLTADGWGTTHVDGGSVLTLGAQTYGEQVVLGQAATFTAPLVKLAGGSVSGAAQTYDGAVELDADTVLTGPAVAFNGAVSGAKILTVNAASIGVNGGAVNTAAQTYGGAVDLGAADVLNASAGDIVFNGAVTGSGSLDATAAGNIVLNDGRVTTTGAQTYRSAVTAPGAITLTGAAINLDGGSVATGGAQNYDGAVDLGTADTLTTAAGDIVLNGAVTGAGSLDATAAGNVVLNNGSVTTTGAQRYGSAVTAPGSITLTAGGGIDMDGGTVVTGGDQNYESALRSANGLDLTAAGVIKLDGGSVATAGAQTYRSAVVLGTADTLTAAVGDITFNATVTGASLDATAGGNIVLNDGNVATTGAQTYRSAVTAPGAIALTGAAINLDGGSVATGGAQNYDGAVDLGAADTLTTTAGDIVFNGAVTGAGSLDATAAGNIVLNNGSVTTTGAQRYGSAVTAPGAMTLTAGGGIDMDGGSVVTGGDQNYQSALRSANGLDLDAGAASINLNGGSVNTAGDQTYRSAVVVGADAALTSGGKIDFLSTLTGPWALTTVSAGDTTLNGAANLGSLDATAATVVLNDGNVTTTGAQTYRSAVTAPGAITLTGAAVNLDGGSVATGGAQNYDGAVDLGVADTLTTTAGDIVLNGAVTGAGSLDATAAGNIVLNGASANTAGDQTYRSAVVLGADAALTSGGKIDFLSTIAGPWALTTVTAGDTTLSGAANLGSLDATAATIKLVDGNVSTTGAQTYRSAVTAPGAVTLTGSVINLDGGSVATGGAQNYDGAVDLGTADTLTTTAGDIVLNGAVTGGGSLDATAAGNIVLNDGRVTTTGAQRYGSAVTAPGAITLTAGGGVDMDGGSVVTGGDQTYASALRSANGLDLTAGGVINLNGGSVATAGAQTYRSAVVLGAADTLTTASGDIAFDAAVTGAALDATAAGSVVLNDGRVTTTGAQRYGSAVTAPGAITLTAGGGIDMDGGSATTGADQNYESALRSASGLTLDAGAGAINLDGGSVATAGLQVYRSAVRLGADTAMTSVAGGMTFASTLDGAHALSLGAGTGDVTFNGAVGDAAHLTGLTVTGSGTTYLHGARVTTDGAQDYGEKVVLRDDEWLATNGGSADFREDVDGTTPGQEGLTVDAAAGDITFWKNVGMTVPLEYLHMLGTGRHVILGSLGTLGDQDYWDDLFLFNDLRIFSHGGNVTFHKRVDGAHNLLVDADFGDVSFMGKVGSQVALASLETAGTGTTRLTGVSIETTGSQTFGQTVALADMTFASAAGDVTFAKAVTGSSLDASAGGAINLDGGAVTTTGAQTYRSAVASSGAIDLTAGGGIVLGPSVTSAGVQHFRSAVESAGSVVFTAGGGIVLDDGRVTTTGAQTYRSAVTAPGAITLAAGGGIDMDGGSVVTGGDQTYASALRSSGALDLDAGANTVRLNGGSVDTAGAQTYRSAVASDGSVVFTAGGGIVLADGRVTTTGAQTYRSAVTAPGAIALKGSVINVDGGSVNTAGSQTVDGAVSLGADTTLTSGGDIALRGAVTGPHGLTTVSSGDTAFGGPVTVASLDASAGGAIAVGAVTTTGDQTYGAAVRAPGAVTLTSGGTIRLNGGELTARGPIALSGPVTAPGSLVIDAGLGSVSWDSPIAALDLLMFGGDLFMRGDLVTTGAGGATLVASRSFQNLGAKAIATANGGRWLIYSIDPIFDVKGGLTGAVQWSTIYDPLVPPTFLGNGFLYRDAPPAPDPVIINYGAINYGGNGGFGGPIGGYFNFGAGGNEVADNWSASPSDIFGWDLGTMRDAVADPDDNSPAAQRRRAKKKAEQGKKKKSIWFKEP